MGDAMKLYSIRYMSNACAAILEEKERAERLRDYLAALFPRRPFWIEETGSFFPQWEGEGLPEIEQTVSAFYRAEKSGLMLHMEIAQAFPEKVETMARDKNPSAWARLVTESDNPLVKGLRTIYAAQARAHWLMINGQWYRKGL